MEIVEFENKWNWGYTINLIANGCGILEVQFQDGYEWGWICGLGVHPSRQKQGIATALMKRAEEVVKEEGFNEIQLSVEKERTWVKEWYERLGYKVIITGDTLYTMRKML